MPACQRSLGKTLLQLEPQLAPLKEPGRGFPAASPAGAAEQMAPPPVLAVTLAPPTPAELLFSMPILGLLFGEPQLRLVFEPVRIPRWTLEAAEPTRAPSWL